MDPKVKAKWIKALRSGKYKQGEGQLRNTRDVGGVDPTFCCLGVLCEIDPKVFFDSANTAWAGSVSMGYGGLDVGGRQRFEIPIRVEKRLIELNDGEHKDGQAQEAKTFNQIADWIEKSKQL